MDPVAMHALPDHPEIEGTPRARDVTWNLPSCKPRYIPPYMLPPNEAVSSKYFLWRAVAELCSHTQFRRILFSHRSVGKFPSWQQLLSESVGSQIALHLSIKLNIDLPRQQCAILIRPLDGDFEFCSCIQL